MAWLGHINAVISNHPHVNTVLPADQVSGSHTLHHQNLISLRDTVYSGLAEQFGLQFRSCTAEPVSGHAMYITTACHV